MVEQILTEYRKVELECDECKADLEATKQKSDGSKEAAEEALAASINSDETEELWMQALILLGPQQLVPKAPGVPIALVQLEEGPVEG